MTKDKLLRQYDGLMLCAENKKYGETKETVRKWMEGALDALVEDVRAERDREVVGLVEKLKTYYEIRSEKYDKDNLAYHFLSGKEVALFEVLEHLDKDSNLTHANTDNKQ